MKLTTREMTLVAIFPAMMAVTAQFNIPMGSLPAISLQTLFVYLAGLTLGWRLAGMSMFVYVMLGVIGLPVFTYGRAIEALGTVSVLLKALYVSDAPPSTYNGLDDVVVALGAKVR